MLRLVRLLTLVCMVLTFSFIGSNRSDESVKDEWVRVGDVLISKKTYDSLQPLLPSYELSRDGGLLVYVGSASAETTTSE